MGVRSIRILREGIFVSEKGFLEDIADLAPRSKPREVQQQVLELFPWRWVYLKKDNLTLIGVLAEPLPDGFEEEDIEDDWKILDADDYIDAEDAYFTQQSGIKILLNIENKAEIKLHNTTYLLPHKTFESFSLLRKAISKHPFDKAMESVLGDVARDRLKHIVRMFTNSEPVQLAHRVWTEKYRFLGINTFRRFRQVIFCINNKHVIEDVVLEDSLEDFNLTTTKIQTKLDVAKLTSAVRQLMEGSNYSKSQLRILKSGIFVSQRRKEKISFVDRLNTTYNRLDSEISPRGFREAVKDLNGGELTYLIDGQRAHFGTLIPLPEIADRFGWYHPEEVIPATKVILNDDPLFFSGHGIGLPMKHKCLARFEINDDLYHISNHAFSRFLQKAPHSRRLRNLSGYDLVNRRGYLMLMYDLLKDSEPVQRKNAALQFLRHKFKDADFRTSKGWIFVILKDFTVITCYDKSDPLKQGYSLLTD